MIYEISKKDIDFILAGFNGFMEFCENDDIRTAARKCIKIIMDNKKGFNELNGKITYEIDDNDKQQYMSNLQTILDFCDANY